jgi:hypothetical protein
MPAAGWLIRHFRQLTLIFTAADCVCRRHAAADYYDIAFIFITLLPIDDTIFSPPIRHPVSDCIAEADIGIADITSSVFSILLIIFVSFSLRQPAFATPDTDCRHCFSRYAVIFIFIIFVFATPFFISPRACSSDDAMRRRLFSKMLRLLIDLLLSLISMSFCRRLFSFSWHFSFSGCFCRFSFFH